MAGEPPQSESHASGSYRIADSPEAAARETLRLQTYGRLRDPVSIGILERIGVAPGWRCLEVGGGAGSLACWLAERVGETGAVLSTDLDLRFHRTPPANLELRRHDITSDPLPAEHFDLVHARALLQHVPERERAVGRMLEALRPGGWILLEDSDFTPFEQQPRPAAFAALSDAMTQLSLRARDWDRHVGRKLLAWLRGHGLEEARAEGRVWTMRGGEDSAEWYVLAMESAGAGLARAGALPQATVAEALREARDPGFAILSPLSISAWARKPGGSRAGAPGRR